MVVEDEIGHEEDARHEGERQGAPSERTEAPALPPDEQEQAAATRTRSDRTPRSTAARRPGERGSPRRRCRSRPPSPSRPAGSPSPRTLRGRRLGGGRYRPRPWPTPLCAARPRVETSGPTSGARLRARLVRGRPLVAERGDRQDRARLRGSRRSACPGAGDGRRADPRGRWRSFDRPLRTTRRELGFLVFGILGLAFVQLFYFVGIRRLDIGIALVIQYLAPVFVALWARFYVHEPVRQRLWFAIALSLLGLSLVVELWGGGSSLDGLGVLACLITALAYAAYVLMAEARWNRGETSIRCSRGASRSPRSSGPSSSPGADLPEDRVSVSLLGRLDDVTAPVWLLLAYIVVLGTVVPFIFLVSALHHVPARVTIVAMLEPVLAAIVAWVWLDEELAAVQIVGGPDRPRRGDSRPDVAPGRTCRSGRGSSQNAGGCGNLSPSRVRALGLPSSDNPNAFRTGCRQRSGSLRRMPGHLRTTLALVASIAALAVAGPAQAAPSAMETRLVERSTMPEPRMGCASSASPHGSQKGADDWSRHLVRRDSFHHGDLRSGMGEVIAWGTCDWFRPGRAVRMWLRSRSSRACPEEGVPRRRHRLDARPVAATGASRWPSLGSASPRRR